jgi:heme oxygenase (biliverdin-producing, ferredoxin)
MSSNLAVKLRTGTQKAHTAAENVGFVKCFLKGVVTKDSFAKALSNLYFVYSEMETALQRHQGHPVVSKMYFPELNRKASLEKDLEYYYGSDWQTLITPSPATQAYIYRIQEISNNTPELLIAHAYTRYMGDLSGGQMFAKIAQTALRLEENQGISFYHFEQIPDKKAFKDKYRQALDSVSVDEATEDRIVAEANNAFRLNMQAAQELDSSLIQSIGESTFKALTSTQTPGSTELAHT